jgi:hypothetical protein
VREVLTFVGRWSPSSPLGLLGFSLGGNIVLKLAGEAAGDPIPGLRLVLAAAPPIDLARCSEMIARPQNRLYELHFLKELLGQVRLRRRHFPDLPRIRFPQPLTLRVFDDLYTAPSAGYDGVDDYYHRASSLPYISRIAVPTLILTARDDPFIAVGPFERLGAPGPVEVRIVDRGGHLGFLGPDGAGGIRWAEQRLVEWLQRHLQ